MRKRNLTITFAGFSLAMILAAIPLLLHAQPGSGSEPNAISSASSKHSRTSVFVGGTPIMRVQFAADGLSPHQRALAIQARVNRLLSAGPILPSDVTVQDIDANDSAVYVKGHLLFTADRATAQYNDTSAHALAEEWAGTMRRVLPDLTKPTG